MTGFTGRRPMQLWRELLVVLGDELGEVPVRARLLGSQALAQRGVAVHEHSGAGVAAAGAYVVLGTLAI